MSCYSGGVGKTYGGVPCRTVQRLCMSGRTSMFVHARITFTNPGAPITSQHLHRGHYRTTSDARLAERPSSLLHSKSRTWDTRRGPRRLYVHLPLAWLNASPTIFRFSSEWIYIVHPDASGIGVHRLDMGLLRAHTICRRLYRPGRGKSHSHRCRIHSTILVLCRFPSTARIMVTALHRRSFPFCSTLFVKMLWSQVL